jgi:anti-sigma regulatory factor (Ser/Thr protein kinase)
VAIDPVPSPWPSGGSGHRFETAAATTADISAVRRSAAAHLERWGSTNVDDAVLVLSELVTNAVRHGGGAEHILVACHGPWIHIVVHDRSPEPAVAAVDLPAIGGRGLRIVAELSEEWASRPTGDGKAVWATLASSRPGR